MAYGEIDSQDIIGFAKIYRKWGGAVQDQFDDIMDGNDDELNGNAVLDRFLAHRVSILKEQRSERGEANALGRQGAGADEPMPEFDDDLEWPEDEDADGFPSLGFDTAGAAR